MNKIPLVDLKAQYSVIKNEIDQRADAAAFGELHYFSKSIDDPSHKWVFQNTISFEDVFSGNIWPGPSGNYLFTKKSWLKAGRYFEPSLENQTIDSWTFGVRQLGTGAKMVTLPDTWYFHRYGNQSHWVRTSKIGNPSTTAIIAIIPFLDKIEDEDVEYIFSKTGRYSWFSNLSTRPIRIKSGNQGQTGTVTRPVEVRKTRNLRSLVDHLKRWYLGNS